MQYEEKILEKLGIPNTCKRITVVGSGGKTGLIFCLARELTALGKRVAITTTTHMQHIDVLRNRGMDIPWLFAEEGNIKECLQKSEESFGVVTGKTEYRDQQPWKIGAPSENWLALLQMYFDVVLIEADGARHMPVKLYKDWEPALPMHHDYVVMVLGLSGLGQCIGDVSYNTEAICNLLSKHKNAVLSIEDYKTLITHPEGLFAKTLQVGQKNEIHELKADHCIIVLNQANTIERREAGKKLVAALKTEHHIKAVETDIQMYPTYQKKYAMIFLAAGNSVRFGGNKLLEEIDGKPMAEHILEKAEEINVKKILVTQYQTLAEYGKKHGFMVVMNEHPEEGISSSIHLGIEAAGDVDGYLFSVCDQPFLTKQTLLDLLCLADISTKGIIATTVAEKACDRSEWKLGNPNFFSAKYKDNLLSITGDRGGKQVIKEYFEDVAFVSITEKEARDIDCKKDSF